MGADTCQVVMGNRASAGFFVAACCNRVCPITRPDLQRFATEAIMTQHICRGPARYSRNRWRIQTGGRDAPLSFS